MSLGVEFLPVDMTQLVAVVLGCMIPLVFVVGITMRFAAKSRRSTRLLPKSAQ